MNSIQQKIQADVEATAAALKDAKRHAAQLASSSTDIAADLADLEMSLREVYAKGLLKNHPAILRELEKIMDRITRLRELRNMMELGSFSVQVARAIEPAWEVLP